MISKRFFCFLLLLSSMFVLSACGPKAETVPTETQAVFLPTRAVATLEIIEKAPTCQNTMNYIDDVNYPDGTVVAAGSNFLKEWEVQNMGTCTWDQGYVMRFISGEQMTTQDAISIPQVPPGAKGKLSIEFTAPQEPGTYRSEWKLFGSDNRFFGNTLYVEIEVQ